MFAIAKCANSRITEPAPVARAIGAVARLVARAGRHVLAARKHRKDMILLANADDRMLADIGLTRADAAFLSDKPFWRE